LTCPIAFVVPETTKPPAGVLIVTVAPTTGDVPQKTVKRSQHVQSQHPKLPRPAMKTPTELGVGIRAPNAIGAAAATVDSDGVFFAGA
jgi:hypothetical protein